MIRSTVLNNGTRIITKRMEGTRTASFHIHFEAGAWDTDDKNEGAAHFLEHLMFKEADGLRATDVTRRFTELGVSTNAYTWFAETVYYINGIAGEDFYKASELMCKMVSSTEWRKEELEKEKSIILEELNRANDSTFGLLCDAYGRHLNGKWHQYARTELGNANQINAITTKKLRDFHKKFYTTGNCLVVATGDIHHEEIVRLVETFLDLVFGPKNMRDIQEPYLNENRFDMKHECEQAYVLINTPVVGKADVYNELCLDLATTVLGGSMGSRLFDYVREELGLAYLVNSDTRNDRGKLSISTVVGTSHEKVDEALEAVLLITGQLLQEGITEDELKLAKINLLKSLVYCDESSSGMSGRLRSSTIDYGDPIELDRLEQMIKSLSLHDVNGFLSRISPKYLIGTISREVDDGK